MKFISIKVILSSKEKTISGLSKPDHMKTTAVCKQQVSPGSYVCAVCCNLAGEAPLGETLKGPTLWHSLDDKMYY